MELRGHGQMGTPRYNPCVGRHSLPTQFGVKFNALPVTVKQQKMQYFERCVWLIMISLIESIINQNSEANSEVITEPTHSPSRSRQPFR